jgi:hypothetical protein
MIWIYVALAFFGSFLVTLFVIAMVIHHRNIKRNRIAEATLRMYVPAVYDGTELYATVMQQR